MKKTILTAAVLALAVSANAGSVRNSANGVSGVLEGSLGASSTTIKVVVDSLVMSGDALVAGAMASGEVSMFVIEHPSQASQNVVDAAQAGSTWAITKSGNLVRFASEQTIAFIENPSESTSKAIRASGNALRVTITASGEVLSASGQALKDTYGDDMALVLDGSGEIYQVSAGSVVAVKDAAISAALKVKDSAIAVKDASVAGSTATLKFINETSVDSSQVAAQDLSAALSVLSEMPANSFEASTTAGKQYKK
jgi:hypothetical protein